MFNRLVAQVGALDPTKIINGSSEHGGAVYITVVVLVGIGIYALAKMKWIEIPKANAEIKKAEAEIENQTKVADGFKSMSEMMGRQVEVTATIAKCLEGLEDSVDVLRASHVLTHRGVSEILESASYALRAFSHRAATDAERQAITDIQASIERGKRLLSPDRSPRRSRASGPHAKTD